MTNENMQSDRLRYRKLASSDLSEFHALIVDPHVREYLLDGREMDEDWTLEAIADSDALFASHGVGLWLVLDRALDTPIGFVGFRIFESIDPAPQLLYAFVRPMTGRGLATEAARTALAAAERANHTSAIAAVDGPNGASIRVLEKLGFRNEREQPGPFGVTLIFTRPLGPDS